MPYFSPISSLSVVATILSIFASAVSSQLTFGCSAYFEQGGKYVEHFWCPRANDDPLAIHCCTDGNEKYCCKLDTVNAPPTTVVNQAASTGGIVGAVLGVFVFMTVTAFVILVIVHCVYRKRQRSEDYGSHGEKLAGAFYSGNGRESGDAYVAVNLPTSQNRPPTTGAQFNNSYSVEREALLPQATDSYSQAQGNGHKQDKSNVGFHPFPQTPVLL